MGILSRCLSWNNRQARRRLASVPAEGILLLLPHCLQRRKCDLLLVPDPEPCRRCGACDMPALLALRERFGIRCRVAAGGRQALDMVRDAGVRGVLAVACEKELWDGIRAAFPKPVVGVINERPHGPCVDTRVAVERVGQELRLWQEAFNRRTAGAKSGVWRPAKPAPADNAHPAPSD